MEIIFFLGKTNKMFKGIFMLLYCNTVSLEHQYHNHIHSYNNQIIQYIQTLAQVNIITRVLCSQVW